MKHFFRAIRFKIFMILLLGILYPFFITGAAKTLFSQKASGEFIVHDGHIIGAKLIGQKFERENYFWSRPSAVDYNPLASGGSNLGPSSKDLKKIFEDRRSRLQLAHPDQKQEPPQDLLFASGSGVDPHISPESALYQLQRVAKARHMNPQLLQTLIKDNTEDRPLHILGEPTVNVLLLNLALERNLVEQR